MRHLISGFPVQVLSSARQDFCFRFSLLDRFHAMRVDDPARLVSASTSSTAARPNGSRVARCQGAES
jgi:hypothetical protein